MKFIFLDLLQILLKIISILMHLDLFVLNMLRLLLIMLLLFWLKINVYNDMMLENTF